MKRLIAAPLLLAAFCLICFAPDSPAESLTSYAWLSNHEVTEFNEIIWFWTADTFWGPVRSNDFIGLKWSPQFFDRVITSAPRFHYNQSQNVHFEVAPTFNAAPYNFPGELPHLREMADPIIEDDGGRLMTVVRFRGDEGVFVYQYRLGMAPQDSLVLEIADPDERVIFVDGMANIEGTVSGRMTLVTARDLGLIDDIRYAEAEGPMGLIDPDNAESMLGLVSQENIVIRNTIANGRANGVHVDRDDFNRHSIVINASLVALSGSFDFENQNDDWDLYQGPAPDERGSIFLSGSTIQHRRGYIHRSNHNGTGYGKSFHYDTRLREDAPPGLRPGDIPEVSGYYSRLVLDRGPYTLSDVSVNTLVVEPGVTLRLRTGTLTVTDSLIFNGTAENPIDVESIYGVCRINVVSGILVNLNHTNFGSRVDLAAETGSFIAEHIRVEGGMSLNGSISIRESHFTSRVEAITSGALVCDRSIFKDGLYLSGNAYGLISNSDFIDGRGCGISLRGTVHPAIENNIIAWNRVGVDNSTRQQVTLNYNNFFDNEEDVIDCILAAGTQYDDPRLSSRERSDYSLTNDSPCIDAGNPTSPPDPDGSRNDIGAFHFVRPNDAAKDISPSVYGGGLLASPNPFNNQTTISYSLPASRGGKISLFDTRGRLWQSNAASGNGRIVIEGSQLPAGIYLVVAESGSAREAVKLVKVN